MQTYSFLSTILLVNGVPITGYANGDDVIQGARRVDAFTDVVGADGRMIVSQNADRSGQFTIRLQQESESNIYLNSIFDRAERGLFLPVSTQFKNVVSGEIIGGSRGYITKPADFARGTVAQDQEWIIVVEDFNVLFGFIPIL